MTRTTTDLRSPADVRRALPAVLLALCGMLLLVLGTPDAFGAFTTKVSNTNDTSQSAIFTCKAAVTVTAPSYFAYPFAEASGTTAADVSGNSRPGTYGTAGITYGAAGPCPDDSARAVTLDGSTGYVTTSGTTNPTTFTEEIWFNTTSTTGGKLIGMGSSQTGASGSYDRHLYMNGSGNVAFGVYPGSTKVIYSPNTYRDGTWHQAVASLAPSTDANPGMRLYVDGALVASDTTVTTSQAFSGYWRIGYDNLSGWPSSASSTTAPANYFKGSLAWASVYTNALTPGQIKSQYSAGT